MEAANKVKAQATSISMERDVSRFWQKDQGLTRDEKRKLRFIILGIAILMALLSLRTGLNGDDDVQAAEDGRETGQ